MHGEKRTTSANKGSEYIPPLPARVVVQPGEDLVSLLARAAKRMGYPSLRWLLQPDTALRPITTYNVLLLHQKQDYQLLSALFLLDETTLYKLTLHRFAQNLQSPEEVPQAGCETIKQPLLLGRTFESLFRGARAARVCSLCLAESIPYTRLVWAFQPAILCQRHRTFLVDKCPDCGHPIPLYRTIPTQCPACHSGDYRKTPAFSLADEPDLLANQALLLSQLGLGSDHQAALPAGLAASPLLQLLPWQYFRLLDSFRRALVPLFPDHPFLRATPELRRQVQQGFSQYGTVLSSSTWQVILATFHFIFTDWPNHFFAYLEALQSITPNTKAASTGIVHDFGNFYLRELPKRLADPAFDFLRKAFTEYLQRTYRGGYLSGRLWIFQTSEEQHTPARTYLTQTEAVAFLETSLEGIDALLEHGRLQAVKRPLGVKGNHLILVERSSAEALKRAWEGLLSTEAVARSILGLGVPQVIVLTEAGLLTPERGPQVDGYHGWRYKPEEVERFIQTLLNHAVKTEVKGNEGIPLMHVAHRLHVPLPVILTEILDDRLKLSDTATESPLFRRLVLFPADLQQFRQIQASRRRKELGWLMTQEVAQQLNVSEQTILLWVRSGLLVREFVALGANQPHLLFKQQEVERFRSTYMFTPEVKAAIGGKTFVLDKLIRDGVLHPVAGRRQQVGTYSLFLRTEVEQISREERLRIPQVARVLQVSIGTVRRLIQRGEMTVMGSSPRRGRMKYISRSVVEQYQQVRELSQTKASQSAGSRPSKQDGTGACCRNQQEYACL